LRLCSNVRDDAGFSAERTADALGVGLWPSRGCYLYGFELKASRADWLKELKTPAKAEAFVPYCDYWYIVAPDGVVKPAELPPGWGLLLPWRADNLTAVVGAQLNESPKKMPRGMLAALVKRAQSQNPNAGAVADAYKRGKEEGIEIGKRLGDHRLEAERGRRLREAVDKFNKETGINPEGYYDVALLVRAMEMVKAGRTLDHTTQTAQRIAHELTQMSARLSEVSKLSASLERVV
jgi:hypothetical protein